MVHSFGDAFAIARVEGVFMVRGSAQEYGIKWTYLSHEYVSEHSGNHRLFQDQSKERPPKVDKFHGPQPLSLEAE